MDTLLYSLCALFFSHCESPAITQPLSPGQQIAGQRLISLETHLIDEASGLAASARHPNAIWMHNDSGNEPELFLVDGNSGELLETVRVNNAEAYDWEDMAAFLYNGEPWLLVADIGDNSGRRPHIMFYAFPEPEVGDKRITPAWSIQASYEDGPRDCEAVAVDSAQQQILLLSKRDKPPRLYSLPLRPDPKPQLAQFMTEVSSIPAPTKEDLSEDSQYGRYRSRPTAMSLSADGKNLVVVTYKDSYLYPAHADGWSQALNQTPMVIDVPQMAQTEAGGISPDGNGLWVASEQLPTQLFFTPLP